MDVLVDWDNDEGRKVVDISHILPVNPKDEIKTGCKVKMLYEKKWYTGTVVEIEYPFDEITSSSSDDECLADLVALSKLTKGKSYDSTISSEPDDSDNDPTYIEECEVRKCKNEAVKTCMCGFLVCSEHWNKVCKIEHTAYSSADENEEEILHIEKKRKTTPKKNKVTEDVQQHGQCIVCGGEVFSSCVRCLEFLCWTHFDNDAGCTTHKESQYAPSNNSMTLDDTLVIDKVNTPRQLQPVRIPEEYEVEGSEKEGEKIKKRRVNKQKLVKTQRHSGQSFIIPKTMNIVPPKAVGPRCKGKFCTKSGKQCTVMTDADRENIFLNFYQMGNLQRQREFVARHVEITNTKQRTSKNEQSRREKTYYYFFTVRGEKIPVCKVFFQNTLSISEKYVRTSIKNINTDTGVFVGETRGGRQTVMKDRDIKLREDVMNHINRFPKVESHYCRQSSTREYLSSDLSLKKMYAMYVESSKDSEIRSSFSLYKKCFRKMNLSFHRPKKDQCSLCMTFLKGDDDVKSKLNEKYEHHVNEKKKVREIKKWYKEKISKNEIKDHVMATFDLQQVITLPKCRESSVFYKRRLTVFNFTIYNIISKDCTCYTWSEIVSKRGSCEISSCVYSFLQDEDKKPTSKTVLLFADGCGGQNKNSIVASMLLYVINNSKHIKEISLRFFEPFHGQNEGDSAHSAITTALYQAGDVMIPSQLVPIFRLARRKHPYNVKEITIQDVFDFKTLSKDIRILKERDEDKVKEKKALQKKNLKDQKKKSGNKKNGNVQLKKKGKVQLSKKGKDQPKETVVNIPVRRKEKVHLNVNEEEKEELMEEGKEHHKEDQKGRPLEEGEKDQLKQLENDHLIVNDGPVNWTHMVEYRVVKSSPETLFFKTSHNDTSYMSISLKRQCCGALKQAVQQLNNDLLSITAEKYKDLVSLCEDPHPVIRTADASQYYRHLPHN